MLSYFLFSLSRLLHVDLFVFVYFQVWEDRLIYSKGDQGRRRMAGLSGTCYERRHIGWFPDGLSLFFQEMMMASSAHADDSR